MTPNMFQMWSLTHLLTIGVIAVACVLLLWLGSRQSLRGRIYFARRFGLVMLLFFVYEYGWRFTTYGFSACVEQQLLPLHFCAFMSLICIISLW